MRRTKRHSTKRRPLLCLIGWHSWEDKPAPGLFGWIFGRCRRGCGYRREGFRLPTETRTDWTIRYWELDDEPELYGE